MNRTSVTAIIGDIQDTMHRVRDLTSHDGPESASRMEALRCLSDAKTHLEATQRRQSVPPAEPGSSPNQVTRAQISRTFEKVRKILEGIK